MSTWNEWDEFYARSERERFERYMRELHDMKRRARDEARRREDDFSLDAMPYSMFNAVNETPPTFQGTPVYSAPCGDGGPWPRDGVGGTYPMQHGIIRPKHVHKWSAWRQTGHSFDHSGPIEAKYTRWCSECKDYEEQTMGERL